jgi:hypothetical protein
LRTAITAANAITAKVAARPTSRRAPGADTARL